MSTDINLVALKVAHLATLGYNLDVYKRQANTIDGFASPFALRRKKCVGCFRFFSIFDVSGAIVIVGE